MKPISSKIIWKSAVYPESFESPVHTPERPEKATSFYNRCCLC